MENENKTTMENKEVTQWQWKVQLEKYVRSRDVCLANKEWAEKELEKIQQEYEYTRQAKELIKQLVAQFQINFQNRLSSIVSKAMNSVFPDPYRLEIEFVPRRGKTDAEIYFVRNGEKIDPMSGSGGGAVDVAAFALQIALWTIKKNKTRPIFILDEPLKWLKGENYPTLGSEMIFQISRLFAMQILLISHIPELIESADRIFLIEKENAVSKIKIIKTEKIN